MKITVLIPFQLNIFLKRPYFPECVGGTLKLPLTCLENHGLFLVFHINKPYRKTLDNALINLKTILNCFPIRAFQRLF